MVKESINFQNRLLQIRFARAARFNKVEFKSDVRTRWREQKRISKSGIYILRRLRKTR